MALFETLKKMEHEISSMKCSVSRCLKCPSNLAIPYWELSVHGVAQKANLHEPKVLQEPDSRLHHVLACYLTCLSLGFLFV